MNLFFCHNFKWWLGAISVLCFTCVDQIITDFIQTKYGICSLFTGKCNVSVGPRWGICPLFHAPPWEFWVNRPALPWGIGSFSKKKKNEKKEKCPGEGGMGTLGTAWTIIDQAEGQDGWILAKFLCLFLLTESRPIDSHLDRTSLVNKGFIIWPKRQHFLGEQREQSWARLVCQSERRIRFILPAHGYGHIITEH